MTNNTNKNIPSLFDRLSEDGDYITHQGVSNKKMKEMVMRDLLFLLNTTSYYYTNAEETYEYEKSVLNFGIETISGKKSSEVDWAYIERNIKTAIKNDYPDAVITDMTVENKTSYGTFQANKEEYCYKIENNQLRIWEKV